MHKTVGVRMEQDRKEVERLHREHYEDGKSDFVFRGLHFTTHYLPGRDAGMEVLVSGQSIIYGYDYGPAMALILAYAYCFDLMVYEKVFDSTTPSNQRQQEADE